MTKKKKKVMTRLTQDQIDEKLAYAESYARASNAATASAVDSNSNVTQKTLSTLGGELFKDFSIQINRSAMFDKITDIFGKPLAEKYIEYLEEHKLYKHDETSKTPATPYCVAISMYPMLESGLMTLSGESRAPKHLDSYCGIFINLIFAVAAQFNGACLYKDTKLHINGEKITAKNFVDSFDLDKNFTNMQGLWEYADISGMDYYVAENEKQVKINKVYRRKYDKKIYEITSNTGLKTRVSEDHKFKHVYHGRTFEVKAKDLQVSDYLSVNPDYYSYGKSDVKKSVFLDSITDIQTFDNDDDFVYEIETESNWYNCEGFITHNCAAAEFLVYMDKFARQDYGENYLETHKDVIHKMFNSVVYTLNQPAAARDYQCVRADTTQLATPKGFKYLDELKEGDLCYVWKDGKIEIEKIHKLNSYDYDGEMLQFKGKNYQQTVTPNHRVVYKVPNTDRYNIKEAKDLMFHSKLSMPVGSNGVYREPYPISDDMLKLCVCVLTDGYIHKGDNGNRIKIYKSHNRWGHTEIPSMLKNVGIDYSVAKCNTNLFGDVDVISIDKNNSVGILNLIGNSKEKIPEFFNMLNKEQIEIVLDTWAKMDGSNGMNTKRNKMLQCDNDNIRSSLQELAILVGYGSETTERVMKKLCSEGDCTVKYLKLFKRKDKRVKEYNKVLYTGKVWCPSTDAGVVIFREENGIPYISGNSVFWNVSVFDKYFFDGLFENFVFPDMDKPNWETVDKLQWEFLEWLRVERTKALLTFPVLTEASLNDAETGLAKDRDFAERIAELRSKGLSMFSYNDTSPSALASCCFDGSQEVLVKKGTEHLLLPFEKIEENFKDEVPLVYHNGDWKKASLVKAKSSTMYKITTSQGHCIETTPDHFHPTDTKDKKSEELTTDDYLLFNTLPSVGENTEMNFANGYCVGAYVGCGSYDKDNGISYYENVKDTYLLTLAVEKTTSSAISSKQNKKEETSTLGVHNIKFKEFLSEFVDTESGKLNLSCLEETTDFRYGILAGYDEHSNQQKNKEIEVVSVSLGEHLLEEEGKIKVCEPNGDEDSFTKNNCVYVKIASIEKIEHDQEIDVYCFEMKDKKVPYFTLPNGIITHNCRLKNEIEENDFSFSLGAGGVATGSTSVMTIDHNRLAWDAVVDHMKLHDLFVKKDA